MLPQIFLYCSLLILDLLIIIGIYWLWISLRIVEKHNQTLQKQLFSDNLHVLKNANGRAEQLLTSTNQIALDSEKKATAAEKTFEETLEHEVENLLHQNTHALVQTSEDFSNIYTLALKNTKEQYIAQFQKTVEQFDEKSRQSLDELTTTLQQETTKLREHAQNESQQAYSQAIADIATFKKQQMQQVQLHVQTLVTTITAQALEEGLDTQQQEQIVLKALRQIDTLEEKQI